MLWAKAGGVLGLVVAVVVGVWGLLPDIAAFGLRYESTRASSKAVLRGFGPRCTGAAFREWKCFADAEWFGLVKEKMRLSEQHPRLRSQLVSSLRHVNVRGWRGRTLLGCAAYAGHREIVELLISNGADVNTKGDDGWTPLHGAAQAGQREVVELLISRGADANPKSSDGWTPLHAAVLEGHWEVAEFLISKGAAVNAKASSDETPLHFAVLQGHREVVELLISEGADLDARTLDCFYTFTAGDTALDVAESEGHDHIAALLRQNGAKTGKELDEEKERKVHPLGQEQAGDEQAPVSEKDAARDGGEARQVVE